MPKINATEPEVRRGIIERVLLTKLLLSQGLSLCGDTNDPMRFSQGILSLQDALELALGATASFMGARLETKTTFFDYFKRINEKLKEKGQPELPSQKDLSLLNEARVKVKHHGLLQRPEDQRKHVIHVEPFIKHLCGLMGLDLDDLSLSDAIVADKVRDVIKQAEQKLEAEDFKGCAEMLTIAQYELIGYTFNLGPYLKPTRLLSPPPGVHWEDFRSENEVWLLRHGIDVSGFYRLRCLIPEWGVTGKKRELVLWWEGLYRHPGNWSPENLRWAINFSIDMAIKLERPKPGNDLMPRIAYYLHKITAVQDVATFYNHNKADDDWDDISCHFPPPRREIFHLAKGQSITGFAWRNKDQPNLWTIDSEAFQGGLGVTTTHEVEVQEIARNQPDVPSGAEAA